jgi:voltage-gated potassium channel
MPKLPLPVLASPLIRRVVWHTRRHLLARSALYPGLSAIVTDIVSGGAGSELYRITLPEHYCGLTIDELSAWLRADHQATLLSVNRGGRAFVNPPSDFVLQAGDDAIVVAQSLGRSCRSSSATCKRPP